MKQSTTDRQRRALRAQLLKTYANMIDAPNVEKEADFRLKSLRLQDKLQKIDNPRDTRQYTISKHVAGYCMNCEITVSAYSEEKIEEDGVVYCSQGCQAHYKELCGHRKAAASRERNRQSNNFFNTYRTIIPTKQPLFKQGGQGAVYGT